MKQLITLLAGCIVMAGACAETLTPDLPPELSVRLWLSADATVREAQASVAAAGHDADILRSSSNEWTLNYTRQRRRYEIGPDSQEWNAGLERTVRLPGKRSLDGRIGARGVDQALALYEEARRVAARDLIDLWLDARAARQISAAIAQQVQFAQDNRDAVEKRLRAGDAARLDLNVAEADLADVQRLASEATTQAAKATARLQGRFAEAQLDDKPLSEPLALADGLMAWHERIVAHSASLRAAQARREQTDLSVARARADRLPDPTIGVFNGSETYGDERIIGLSISVPLPGAYRGHRLARALDDVDAADAALAQERQRLATSVAVAYADATGSFERWQLAATAAGKSSEAARLTQRAYKLGEIDLQSLLLARRQALDAARTELTARLEALRSRYAFLLDAGELWSDKQP